MSWPATLTLVTVAIRFDLPPSGGATGKVAFTMASPLSGPTDGSVIPPNTQAAYLAADGTASIQLPATNDPQWTPQDWAYTVTAYVGTAKSLGTLQLDYLTTSVELADLIQWDGAAVTGTTYATLAQLAAHEADTTSVHGITDTAALVLTSDARLSDARTPTAHASTHASAGSDPVALAGSQITSGTVAYARLPVGASSSTVAAGDDTRITGALQTTGGTVTGDLVVDGAVHRVDGAAGTFRQVQLSTADSVRWSIHANNTAEGGANAGSDWRLVRYDDAGQALDAPIGVTRSTGAVAFGGPVSVGGVDFRLVNSAIKPTDHNLAGWTFDPDTGVQGGTVMPTSGLGHVARVQALSTVVTNIVFNVTVGGSGLTGFYASVQNDAGALIGGAAVTGNGAAAMGSAGLKVLPLSVAQGLTQYSFYRILFWFTGTTGPTLSRGLATTSGLVTVGQTSAFRFATADTGLVATPPSNLAALTADTAAWWVGLS